MEIISTLLVNTIILVFPILVDLIYMAHNKNIDKEKNNTFLDFALVSSLYIFYEHCVIENEVFMLCLINIPLFIALINKRELISIFLSITLIHIYHSIGISYGILLTEFLSYYAIYICTYHSKRRNDVIAPLFIIDEFIIFIAILYFMHINIWNSICILITFMVLTSLILYLLKISDEIVKLNMNVKELEKEKQIRDSLFKITHEIKNPIAVCKTYLDMFDFSNRKHAKYIPIIKEEIDKTLLLLQDFLAMNKIKLNKEILDINMLLEDVSSQFDMVMKSKNIIFTHEISDEEIFIEGDYNRLNQVLTNIIKNSIEALDKNQLPYISLTTEVSDDSVKIIISDNGIGMSEEHLSKIKEPFYTTKQNGSGLGVSLSYNIMEAHGGKIEYDSKEYYGTQVKLILPLANII